MANENSTLAQLPPVPPQRLKVWAVRFMVHQVTYNTKYQDMVLVGWTFADLLGDGLGSDAKLAANGTWDEGGGAGPEDHFARDWNPEDWFPWQLFVEPYWTAIVTLQSISFFFDWTDIATYHTTMGSLPFILSAQAQYRYGVGSRAAFRMWQLKAAMNLEILWGFDNRGRPAMP